MNLLYRKPHFSSTRLPRRVRHNAYGSYLFRRDLTGRGIHFSKFYDPAGMAGWKRKGALKVKPGEHMEDGEVLKNIAEKFYVLHKTIQPVPAVLLRSGLSEED